MAQFLVDKVQFIGAEPLDVRLTGEERRFLSSTRTLTELRIISSRRTLNEGVVVVVLPCHGLRGHSELNGTVTRIASMCPDAVEEVLHARTTIVQHNNPRAI